MTLKQFLAKCESEFLGQLMAKHNGNARAAAREAGIHKASLYRLLHRLKLRPVRVYGNAEWRAMQ